MSKPNYKTIKELSSKKELMKCVTLGFEGKSLIYELYSNSGDLKVSSLYQRLLSILCIKKYKKLDLKLLIPAVIARRPKELGNNSGDWLIDGQHKAVLHYLSGVMNNSICFPAMVYVHEENATLEECEKIEAEIFYALNTQRKKLSKIDEIRAGVVFKDSTSLWVERILTGFHLHIDGFGYDGEGGIELKSFNQFYLTLTNDYLSGDPESQRKLAAGNWLWAQMFHNSFGGTRVVDTYITGPMFRTCCLLAHFIDEVLENGREENFKYFIINVLPRMESQTTLCKGYIDANAHKYIFHSILDRYKIFCQREGLKSNHCIGDTTMKEAVKINKRFKRPDNF